MAHMQLLLAVSAALPAHAGFAKGPYLQSVSKTGITVSWQSDASETGQVEYGTTSSLGATVTESVAGTVHQVELTGLEPSTTYSYRVTSGGSASSLATFATAVHDEEPFSFVVVGDTRTDTDSHQQVIDQLLTTVGHPDLYFNSGDLVEDGGDAGQWTDFFDTEAALMAGSPLFPVAGNHDDVTNDSLYTEYFALPAASSGSEAFYAFTYGNTRFVILDTNDDFTTGSDQYEWLEDDLAAAAADPGIVHIVALFHDPPYTSGGHGAMDYEDWWAPRTYLSPLLESYGVAAVFNGHDHHYERSDPDLTGGTVYVVSGGGGAPGAPGDFVDGLGDILGYLGMDEGQTLGEFLEENSWVWDLISAFGYAEDYEGGWWRAEAEVMKHFILVEVAGTLMTASVYTDEGELFEEWTIGAYDPELVDDDGDTFTEREGDCDDADASLNPDAEDVCDGVDTDCDGIDNGCDTGGDTDEPDTDEPDTDEPDDEPADSGDEASPDGENGGKGGGCGCAAGETGTWWLLGLAAVVGRRRTRR